MNERTKMNDKGFSLVELIVVIAIMAILVGALAPQLIRYIDKSRAAADVQTAGTVYTAIQTALGDPDITTNKPSTGSYSLPTGFTGANQDPKDFNDAVWEAIGQRTPSYGYYTVTYSITLPSTVEITLTSPDATKIPDKTIDASGSH